MLLYKDIVKDGNEVLRLKANDVLIPLSNEDKQTLKDMHEYLANGYDEEFVKKHDLRPGVGIAAPQLGISKKMFAIMAYDEYGDFHDYCIINPKIISHSLELTYLETGEGCLSVEDNHRGYIHRYKRIKANCFLYDINKDEITKCVLSLKGYLAIVFQHEYDHLFGTLFFDHIDKINPFFVPENSKPVSFE